VVLVLGGGSFLARTEQTQPRSSQDAPDANCVYTGGRLSLLVAFEREIGRTFDCAMIFNNANPSWAGWSDPWFVRPGAADTRWAAWARSRGAHRQLIITQDLFPNSVDGTDWLEDGASGRFDSHDRALARNLVRAGLGNAIIRLAHEANGTWEPYSVPATRTGDAQWVKFWRNAVLAMQSVAGAHFRFDWTINSGYRALPLQSFYPGNDVVSYIGIDVYDTRADRRGNWKQLEDEPDGVAAVAAFASAHHKPMSIPEWGLGPAQDPSGPYGGDDPSYVEGIADIAKHDDVAYQSYFDQGLYGLQLQNSPRSLAAYKQAFGATSSPGASSFDATQLPPEPAVAVTAGPAYGATITTRSVTFSFSHSGGSTLLCSLDQATPRACSSNGRDTLMDLSDGFHSWTVEVETSGEREAVTGRVFTVEDK
jgi:hypothetical protein